MMIDRSELAKVMRNWIEENTGIVTPTNPLHIHLDEFIQSAPGEEVFQVVHETLVEGIHTLGPRLVDIMPVGVIPLTATRRMTVRPPSEARMPLGAESPSIYLIHRDGARALRLGELYRVPFHRVGTSYTHPDVFCFYEVFRAEKARRLGWEYTRTILCEHYLPEHRVSWDSTTDWP
jgi:hypothetical protein